MSNLKSAKDMDEGGIISKPKTSINFNTGTWRSLKPVIDESKCIHCDICVVNCPENCIDITKDKKRGDINLGYCKGCSICSKVCPVGAITMVPDDK